MAPLKTAQHMKCIYKLNKYSVKSTWLSLLNGPVKLRYYTFYSAHDWICHCFKLSGMEIRKLYNYNPTYPVVLTEQTTFEMNYILYSPVIY